MKKNECIFRELKIPGLEKVLRIMKLTTFLILLSVITVFAGNSYSQSKSLSLEMKNSTVKEVLRNIEEQSEFVFMYSEKIVDVNRKVSVNIKNQKIDVLLDKLFAGTGVNYEVKDRFVLLTRAQGLVNQQAGTVAGRVTDSSGEPLPGVTVIIKGTTQGTITDFDGNYTISNVPAAGTLVFSFVGMRSEEIAVGNQSTINLVMEEDAIGIEEVVAIGYGSVSRKDVTGSVASVKAEDIANIPVPDIDQALSGQIAGLNVVQRSAGPGRLSSVTIRGMGSISAGVSPLYVVDGFPTDQANANAINPADIASIDVLKDASATSIYGSRGANGVIIITTKRGVPGKARIRVNVSSGFADANENDFYDMLDGSQYIDSYLEYRTPLANALPTVYPIPDAITNYDGTNTDWQSELYQTALYNDVSLAVEGGNEKVTYLFSGGYLNQEGIVLNTGYERYTSRMNLEYRQEKITLGSNVSTNFTKTKEDPIGDQMISPTSNAVYMPPIVPLYNEDGTYGNIQDIPGLLLHNAFLPSNPVQLANEVEKGVQNLFSTVNMFGELEIINGLFLKSSIGTNFSHSELNQFIPNTIPSQRGITSSTNTQTKNLSWINENTVTFKRDIDRHSFTILGGFTVQKYNSYYSTIYSTDYAINTIHTLNAAGEEPNTFNFSTTKTAYALASWFGRLNYNFNDRYLLTGTVRRDGSSRFGSENRYGVFPSFALAWRLSNESFMNNLSFIDDAKMRFSFGSTGNYSIPNFRWMTTMTTTSGASFGLGSGNSQLGVGNISFGDAGLTWEKSEQLNIGFDLMALNQRIYLVFDYYNNTTSDLLLNKNVPATTGTTSILTNIGSVRNKGVELTLNAQIINNRNFRWSVGGNINFNDIEVLELGPSGKLIGDLNTMVTEVGGEIDQIQGLEWEGRLVTQEDIDGGYVGPLGITVVGDAKYKDQDGDNKISFYDGPDAILFDTNVPDYTYAFNTNFGYRNWDLSIMFQGQEGSYVLDLMDQLSGGATLGLNYEEHYYLNRYRSPENPGDGKTPIEGGVGTAFPSSYMLNPTSYLRLRNVTLSYNFTDLAFLGKMGVSYLRVYATGENLLTFTDYHGGNPNATRRSGTRLSDDGITLGNPTGRATSITSEPSTPLPQTFTFGLNVTF